MQLKMQAPLIFDLDDDDNKEGSDGSASCVVLKTDPGRPLIFLVSLMLVMSPPIIVTYWFRKRATARCLSDTVAVSLWRRCGGG